MKYGLLTAEQSDFNGWGVGENSHPQSKMRIQTEQETLRDMLGVVKWWGVAREGKSETSWGNDIEDPRLRQFFI